MGGEQSGKREHFLFYNETVTIPMKHLPNLLIVDDSEENLIFLEIAILKLKVNLIKALSGSEALEKTRGVDLALAIIDVRMPKMNGFELALKLNEERSNDKVPVVFLTASHFSEMQVFEGYDTGAVDYIFKPVDSHILLCKIKVFLGLFNQKQTIIQDAALLKKSAEKLSRINDALKKSEEKYRSYIDNAPDGIFIADETGRYIEVNEAACGMTGYSKEELLKMSISDILIDESLGDGQAQFRKTAKTGTSKADLVFKHKTGAKRWWTVESVMLLKTRFLTFAKDITQRKEMEEVLKTYQIELEMQNDELNLAKDKAEIATHKYTELYDFAPTGYFTLSKEGEIQKLNHSGARMLGKERSQLIDNQFGFFVSRNTLPAFNTFFRNVFESKENETCEVILETANKQIKYVHIEGTVVGNDTQCLVNVVDITERKQTESVLRESESNLAAAQRIAHIGSWEWDVVSNRVKWSKEMFRVFDLKPDTFKGKIESVTKALHPDDVELFIKSLKGKLPGGNSHSVEYRVIYKDGSIHNLSSEGRIEFDKAGNITRSIGTVQDITERKRVENRLENIVNIFNETGKMAKVGGWELNIVSGIQRWTEETYHIFEIDLNRDEPLLSDVFHFYVPESRAIMEKAVKRAIKYGESYDLESEIITAKGNPRWVRTVGKANQQDGKTKSLSGATQDITDRKKSELFMKVSEEKYKTMLNVSPDGILLIDLKGIITEVSDIGGEILGANAKDDLVGKNFLTFVPFEEKQTIKEIIEITANEGIAQNIGLLIRKKNQALFAAEISSALIQDQVGSPVFYMVIIRDISQRKKTEAKQIHADRMANLGEMASGIAHEINQPLNIISMVLDKILFEADKAQTIELEFLKIKSEKIFENITRIRNIIDHIRAFSRSHNDYVLTTFEVNLSIENAVSMIVEQFKYLGISLSLQLKEQLPQIFGNTYELEQVILNLLMNAKDAVIDKKSKQEEYVEMIVGIRSYLESQFLIVEVSDNGIGISEEDINNIMLPFYTTKEEGKGTGLGLSICYQIIKGMGGTIEILSDRFLGTRMKIVLNIQKKKGSSL